MNDLPSIAPLAIDPWRILNVLLLLACVVLLVPGRAWKRLVARPSRGAEPETSAVISGGLSREDRGLPPRAQAYPFFCLGVCWEVRERFSEIFLDAERPNSGDLDDAIHGPRCAGCSALLIREHRHGWMASGARSYYVDNPCPQCRRATAPASTGERDVRDLKLQAYREAQRLAIRGEALPAGDCAQALRKLGYW